MNNVKNKIELEFRKTRSRLTVFVYEDGIFQKTGNFDSDKFTSQDDLWTLGKIQDYLGIDLENAKIVQSKMSFWMDGISNGW